ncbi:MAG: apolipoprotein N-acyltransferase [Pseudomonadota bacterium]
MRRPALLALPAGAVAALGQAPFDLWYLAIPAFAAGLVLVGLAARPGRAAWSFGAAYFAVALHWVVEPFFVDAARHGWMAPFGLAGMAGGMALFWLVAGWSSRHLPPGMWRIVGFAVALGIAELARAYGLSGFPWAHPGHILIDTRALALSGVGGPHLLTAIVLVLAVAIAALSVRGTATAITWRFLALVPLAIGTGVLLGRPMPPAPAPGGDAPRVALVQPNAAQHLKWQPDMVPVFFEAALALTAEGAAAGADLIVWPETALAPLLEDSAPWRAEMAAASGDAALITGVQRFDEGRARNTLAHLTATGDIAAVYDKHRLVPFGEYIPVRALAAATGLDGLAAVTGGGYWPGAGPAALDLGPGLGRAFVMICYEAIFPQYLRQIERPDWQLHITNDAWFGTFSGPFQHLALARLRAAESGLPVLRAANTGISAVIDGRGRFLDSAPLGVAAVVVAEIPPALPPTPYSRHGDAPMLALYLALAATLALGARKRAVEPAA